MIINFNKFKLNEGLNEDLGEKLSDYAIDDYYDENLKINDISEIIELITLDDIFNNFNENRFFDQWIDNEINSENLENFESDPMINYLENIVELDDDDKSKIIGFYKDNNDVDEEVEFDEELLSDLDTEQLRELIVDHDTYDFIVYEVNKKYEGANARETLKNFNSFELPNSDYSNKKEYNSVPEMIYDLYVYCIDADGIVKDWNSNTSFETKKEEVQNTIYCSPTLQLDILDEDTVLQLAELFEVNPKSDNIGDEYIFQKYYIDAYVSDSEDDEKESYEDALLYLDDNFNLDKQTRQEYSGYMKKVKIKDINI